MVRRVCQWFVEANWFRYIGPKISAARNLQMQHVAFEKDPLRGTDVVKATQFGCRSILVGARQVVLSILHPKPPFLYFLKVVSKQAVDFRAFDLHGRGGTRKLIN